MSEKDGASLHEQIETAGWMAMMGCGTALAAYASTAQMAGWLAGMAVASGVSVDETVAVWSAGYQEGLAAAQAGIERGIVEDAKAECRGSA